MSAEHLLCTVQSLGHKCFIGTVTEASNTNIVGKKCLLNYVVPGEQARVVVTKDKKSFVRADLVNLEKTSPKRVVPACEYFGSCGGCDLQHIDNNWQRELKLNHVKESLERQLGCVPLEGITLEGEHLDFYHYRRRIQIHVDKAGDYGFYAKSSNKIVPVRSCQIVEEGLEHILNSLSEIPRTELRLLQRIDCELVDNEIHLTLHSRKSSKVTEANKASKLTFFCKTFPNLQLSNRSATDDYVFSQTNSAANQVLLDVVAKYIDQGPVTELYAGFGNFSFYLARNKGVNIDAVELSPKLVDMGQRKSVVENLSHLVKFHCCDVETYLRENEVHTTLLLDPPRAGAINALKALTSFPKRIVYVSCYLPSLIRDLKFLLEQSYELKVVKVIDMFPQTFHVETVSVLEYRE